MAHPLFVVPLADLEQGARTFCWVFPLGWLREVLTGTDASATSPGEVTVELSLNGRQVVVRGQARVEVVMPCARTLEPVTLVLRPEIFLLLEPAGPFGGPGRTVPARPGGSRSTGGAGWQGDRDRRRARGSRSSGWSSTPVLTEEEAARDTYTGQQVVLDEFFREFILLELPIAPLASGLPEGRDAGIG